MQMWNKISEADFLRYFGISREGFDGLRLAKMAEKIPDSRAEKALNFLVENGTMSSQTEILLRRSIQACGICRTDIHIAEGDLPLKKSPLIPGHEIVGVVEKTGKGVKKYKAGDPVGISWLYSTCGRCEFCRKGKENYCPDFRPTGWDADGGFAEYITNYAASRSRQR